MNHLDHLTIHRFRGLRDLNLNSLGKINLFVGINNSGKTSVLEAISTYCRPLDPLEWLRAARRREIKSSRKPILDAVEWLFPHYQDELTIEFFQGETSISGEGEFPIRKSSAIYQAFEGVWQESNDEGYPYEQDLIHDSLLELDTPSFDLTKRGAEIELKVTDISRIFTEQELSRKFILWENERSITKQKRTSTMLPVETITPFSHRIELLEVEMLSEAILQGVKTEVINLLQIMDAGILDLEILSRSGIRPSLYIEHKNLGLAPLSVFGDGVRRLLFIALALIKVRGGVLLIDELETAIHTEALQSSFSWLVQLCLDLNIQLFATTHSLEVVDNLIAATTSIENLVLYRLEQKEYKTHAIRLDGNRLKRLREDVGQEVRW